LYKNFTDCNVLIHDEEGNLLADVKIWEHTVNTITVQTWPELEGVENCKLFIVSKPVPYSYSGVIRKKGFDTIITLYNEKVEEHREEARYDIKSPGYIEGMFYGEKLFPLHTKREINIVNVSKHGMCISDVKNAFNIGDKMRISVQINDNTKMLIAEVVNINPTHTDSFEYGCHLTKDGE
jgi:hypothetical protein